MQCEGWAWYVEIEWKYTNLIPGSPIAIPVTKVKNRKTRASTATVRWKEYPIKTQILTKDLKFYLPIPKKNETTPEKESVEESASSD